MRQRTTFNVDDWITHTPKSILAKNFGVNESIFDTVPTTDPYIAKGNVSSPNTESPYGKLQGNSSYVYHLSQHPVPLAPGGGGTLAIVDSRNFPIATTIAAAIVTLEPKGLRELHWHPNVSSQCLTRYGSKAYDSTPLGRRVAILPPRSSSRYRVSWWSNRPNVRFYCW